MVVGGVAAILRGRLRTTQDLDLIIENNKGNISLFLNLIKTMEFEVLDEQVKFGLVEGFNISISDKKSFLRIDLKVAKTPDDNDVFKNSNQEEYEGKSVLLATIDQILYGKVLYIGEIEDISDTELLEYNDVLDFVAIYQAHREDTNLIWLKKKAEGKGLGKTLSRLLRLARVMMIL